MARTRYVSPRYLAARGVARVWACVGLASLVATVPLFMLAISAGYLASPMHALWPIFAAPAFAAPCLAIFSLFAWFEYDAKVDKYR